MFTLLVLLLLIVIFFTVASKGSFFSLVNVRNILNAIVIVALLTVGAGALMISGQIDLSTGSSGTMCGILMAILLGKGWPWPAAIAAALATGGLTGAINAILINELHFQGFIATMAMASVTQGLSYAFGSAQTIPVENNTVVYMGTGRIGDVVPVSIIAVLLIFFAYGVMLNRTKFGRSVYLVGGNPAAASLVGIDPKRISYILFVNSGVLGSLAGCLLAARLKSATVTGIVSNQFSGMTAAILGGVSFGGGSGGMFGAFVGLLILNSFSNGMTLIRISPYWQTFASGALLLFALSLDFLGAKRKA
jgi:ribose/xylose/arabinose/galactoside ABC-type transport system permease subunit